MTGAVATVPALEVGGDFYDVIRLPGGRVGVLVGDVSGKGVPGALFGARLLSDVRYEALYQDDVGATLTAVNRLVAARATRGMFVTFLYVVLDPANRSVQFAQRRPPSRRSCASRGRHASRSGRRRSGLPLGILPDARYEVGRAPPVRPAQTLLLLTDGLADAVGPAASASARSASRRSSPAAPATRRPWSTRCARRRRPSRASADRPTTRPCWR